jgi:FkbM family methyltransferase
LALPAFQRAAENALEAGYWMTPLLDLQPEAKTKAKAVLPKSLVNFISGCRYRGYLAHIDYLLKAKKYQRLYLKANATAPDSAVVLPTGGIIQVPTDVRAGFDRLGWSYLDEVDEFISCMNLASDKKVLWDVGAYCGLFSLAFALGGEDRRAYAFEPNPVSHAKLKECLNLNPTAKVEVFDFPVGLPGQVVEFHRGPYFTDVAGLSVRPDEKDLTRRETVSIDELIEKELDPPDMIKIDVEGLEFDVLQGARKLLLASKPLLSMELHPILLNRRNTSALAIAQYLEGLGYLLLNEQLKPVKKSRFKRGDNFRIFAM